MKWPERVGEVNIRQITSACNTTGMYRAGYKVVVGEQSPGNTTGFLIKTALLNSIMG